MNNAFPAGTISVEDRGQADDRRVLIGEARRRGGPQMARDVMPAGAESCASRGWQSPGGRLSPSCCPALTIYVALHCLSAVRTLWNSFHKVAAAP